MVLFLCYEKSCSSFVSEMTASRGEEFLVWVSDDKSSKFYGKFNIHDCLHVFFFTQKMNKSDVYRKRTRRPMSTSVIQSKVDSKSLIGQTLRVQDWLNEKTVKGLQVMYRKLAKETSYHYELVAWFQYEVDIIYLFINIYQSIFKFIYHPSIWFFCIYI